MGWARVEPIGVAAFPDADGRIVESGRVLQAGAMCDDFVTP